MTSTSLKDARTVWKYFNGAMCIYKPPKYPWLGLSKIIRQKIFTEINAMVPTTNVPYELNPLVVGPMLTRKQVPIYSTLTDYFTSGVAGLRQGWKTVSTYRRRGPLKVYHVKGQLGIATDTYDTLGKIGERATFHFVRKDHLDKIAAAVQSRFQRSMYDACGVNLQSQAAYELAATGMVRPLDHNLPVFYSIKCVDFEPPEFTLEVQCINETAVNLKILISEIGFRVRSVAACSGIRCIRNGPFTVDHALVRHKWNVANFLENMDECTKLLITDLVSDRRKSPSLIESPDSSWEATEQKLIERGIIKKRDRLGSGENAEAMAAKLISLPEDHSAEENLAGL